MILNYNKQPVTIIEPVVYSYADSSAYLIRLRACCYLQ